MTALLPVGAPSHPEWMLDAACRGHEDPDLWFPATASTSAPRVIEALTVCATCPVRRECADHGAGDPWGIWGGLTPPQRRAQTVDPTAVDPTAGVRGRVRTADQIAHLELVASDIADRRWSEPGPVEPGDPCPGCGRGLAPRGTPSGQGLLLVQGRGLCNHCYTTAQQLARTAAAS